ncbi:MAG: hypothetical protein QF664_02685 [Dehalococcoidia bacterium]|nr:hypothetical protein [Dehalococcoidia bacterium]
MDHDEEFPQLRTDETFLHASEESDWAEVASLAWKNDWSMLAQSFFDSADILVTTALGDREGRSDPMSVIAPALYLYRHALELQLKAVQKVGEDYDGEVGPRRGHFLMPLWKQVRDYMERHFGWQDEAYDTIELNIQLLDELDEKSMVFRYPDEGLPPGAERLELDLRQLRRVFRGIHPWLAGVWDARDAELEMAAEMAADYGPDFSDDVGYEGL